MRLKSRLLVVGILLGALAASVTAARPTPPPEMVVYKSASCGCCRQWVDYLKAKGYKVTSKDLDDAALESIKAELGVTRGVSSCHTAVIAGYVVEGHVPAGDIERLLREKPKVLGLSAPGMPGGAPGMDTSKDPYDVLTFDAKGTTTVFAHH